MSQDEMRVLTDYTVNQINVSIACATFLIIGAIAIVGIVLYDTINRKK